MDISLREAEFLSLFPGEEVPVDKGTVVKLSTTDKSLLPGIVASLVRKQCIVSNPELELLTLTVAGAKALADYRRIAALKEPTSQRPPGVPPPISVVDYIQAQLENARASLKFQEDAEKRKHPYSPTVDKTIDGLRKKVEDLERKLEIAKHVESELLSHGLPIPWA